MNALYSLYDALVSINVPTDKARAVVDAMERDMTTLLATKADLANTQLLQKQEIESFRGSVAQEFAAVRQEMAAMRESLKQEIGSVRDSLKHDIESSGLLVSRDLQLMRSSVIIWLGSAQIVGMGLLFAALRLT